VREFAALVSPELADRSSATIRLILRAKVENTTEAQKESWEIFL
jgi:hypothetical protein